jgi:hypothetical protein
VAFEGACSRVSGGHLVKVSWTGIDRHVMVKDAASPDNPALTGYWAKQWQRMKSLLDEYTLRLLTRQDARCPRCREHPHASGNGGSRPPGLLSRSAEIY